MNDMQQQGTLKFSDLNLHIKTEPSIDQSLIVWRGGLSLPNVLKSCMDAENSGRTFWTELGKLHKVSVFCSQNGGSPFMEFCFIYINAMQKYDCMPPGNLPIRELPDFCKRVHLKWQIKDFIRGSWLDQRATSVRF